MARIRSAAALGLATATLVAAFGARAAGATSPAGDGGVPAQETLDATARNAGAQNLADGGVGGAAVGIPNIGTPTNEAQAGAPSSSSDGGPAVPAAAVVNGAPAGANPGDAGSDAAQDKGGPHTDGPGMIAPLGLRDLQTLARQADPRAMIAYAQLEGAQGKRDEADWIWFPDFATTVGAAGPTPEARLNGGDEDPNIFDLTPGTRKGLLGGEWGVGVRLNMQTTLPIYTFGKITAGQAAAKHGVEARSALLQGSRNQAAFDVARAYWSYQTTRDAQKSINDTRDRLAQARKQAQQLLDDKSDQVTATDVARLDYISDETEAQSDAAIANQRLAEAALKLLVGRMPEEPLAVVRETVPTPPAMPDMKSLLETARARRPDLKAAEENVEAHAALLDLERAKYYPDVGIIGGIIYANTTNASAPDSPFVSDPYNQLAGYVALGIKGTFDIPQKMARVKQVEAQLHEAIATQVGAERLVRLDIEQAMADLASARGRAEHYISGSAKAKKLLTKGFLALDSGLGQASELLIDALLYSRAEGERLKALLDAQIAWANLERAVGAEVVQVMQPLPPDAVLVAPANPALTQSPTAPAPPANPPGKAAAPAKALPARSSGPATPGR